MATNDLGLTVPASTDDFNPDGDMRTMGMSFAGRVIVPVANTTERDALATTLSPSTSEPLIVFRADASTAPIEYTTDGSTWVSPMTQPHTHRAQSSDQTLTTSTFTTLIFGTEVDADTTETITYSAGKFTVGLAGVYALVLSAGFDANDAGTRQLEIKVNGTTVRYALDSDPVSSIPSRFGASVTLRLSASDEVEFYGYQSSGGNLNTESGAYTSCSITRVSA